MADDPDLAHEIFCVLRAQSGSHDALKELFKLLQEPLFRYLKNLVRDEFKAEDILQEVFIRIYRKLKWLREPAALRSWAFQIATREAFRYLKCEKRWGDETTDEELLDQATSSETENFPREMINQLPELIGNGGSTDQMKRTFLILALLGMVVPPTVFAPFVLAHGLAPGVFVKQLFATPLSRFFAFDVLLSPITFWVFMLREGRRLEMKNLWIYVVFTLLAGVSLGLPLFLLFRETKMSHRL